MLELDFDVKPDANGIIDGRELASGLIQMAYTLLMPYVDNCPACADRLFSNVTQMTLEGMHQTGDLLYGKVLGSGPDYDGSRWKKHIQETGALTEALLGNPDNPHLLH